MLTRADLNEISPVCLFSTPKETITEIKIRIGGGRKIEFFGSGGASAMALRYTVEIYRNPHVIAFTSYVDVFKRQH